MGQNGTLGLARSGGQYDINIDINIRQIRLLLAIVRIYRLHLLITCIIYMELKSPVFKIMKTV